MHRFWITALALLLFLCALAGTPALGEGVERVTSAFDAYLQSQQIISQREKRFNVSDYQYIKDRFVINGCGPASVHNAMAVAFGLDDTALSEGVLIELMTLMADFKRPAEFGINYKRMYLLTEPACDEYASLTELKTHVDETVWLKRISAKKLIAEVDKREGSLVVMGRTNLMQNWSEIVTLADLLHERGLDEATITVGTLSSGTPSTGAPFNMGETGHFLTVCIQVGEFLDRGTIYVLDSYPRAVRGESLSDVYDKKYYFAENNKLTSFRLNYDAYHLTPMVVKCAPLPEVRAELTALREAAEGGGKKDVKAYFNYRVKLAKRITTYGTGTLFLRVR